MDEKQLLSFFDEYNIAIKGKKEYPNFTLYNLEECPFCNGAHKEGSYIVHNNNGVVVAKCHHNSCKDASWSKLYEIKTGKKLTPKKSKNKEKNNTENWVDIVNKIYEEGLLDVFLDNYGNIVAKIISMDDSVMKMMPIKSFEFRIHIQRLLYDKAHIVLDRRTYETVLDYIAILAYKKGNCITVYKRICYADGKIIYELDKDKNVKVVISKDGIAIVDDDEAFFHHSKYFANQVMPDFDSIKENDYKMLPRLIRKHFNFSGNREVALFTIYLVTSFLGNAINHPIMSISGQKGSGKSSAIKKFCQIVDPKHIGLGNIPKTEDDISLRISENYVNAFDNLSYINKSISDLFCKCVTGGTNVRRTLYENNDETTFDLKSIIVLNGIDVLIYESDLQDRSLFFHLERLTSDKLKTEAELDEEFLADMPKILALCFSVLQLAMTDEEPVDKSEMIRMADFFEWAVKIGRVLGYEDKYVVGLLHKNRDHIIEQSLSENPLAQLLLLYMEYVEIREHTVSEFLKILKKLAVEQQVDTKLLPNYPNVLSRKINRIKSDLESVGITYDIKNKGYSKVITIKNSHPKRIPVKIVTT